MLSNCFKYTVMVIVSIHTVIGLIIKEHYFEMVGMG